MNTTIRHPVRALIRTLLSRQRVAVATAAACTLTTAGTIALQPLLVQRLVNTALVEHNSGRATDFAVALIVVMALGIVAEYWRTMSTARFAERALTDLRVAVFERGVRATSNDERPTLGRAINDTGIVARDLAETIPGAVGAGLGVIASSITLIVIAPVVFALIAASVAAMFIPVSIWYRRRTRLALMTFLARYDDMAQSLGETSAGAPIAWAFGRPDQAQRFGRPNLEEGAAFQHLTELAAKYTPLVAVQQGIAMAVAIAITPFLIDGSQQLGVLAAFVVALPSLFGGLNELAHLIEHLTTGSTALIRLAPLGLQIPSSAQPISGAPARGSDLRLDRVRQTFDFFTLGPITMTFRPGVTAIIGETGAGKSTLARLIAGLDTPTEGTITTPDGRPSRDLRLSGRIVMLPQQPQLFPGTIHDNLSLARPAATANELSAFIEAHGLGDWLQHLPHSLSSAADHTLSEGDRHIASLVQTLLKDPDIVILDEPTVSLDPLSANRVERATTAAFAHRVVILITHSLETARHANSIAVLDAGQLVDHGTHDELVQRCQCYRQLTGEG